MKRYGLLVCGLGLVLSGATGQLQINSPLIPVSQTGVQPPPTPDNAPLLPNYTCSWLANSFPGNAKDRWVQHWAFGMAVHENGTVYLTTPWEEAGQRGGIYKDGKCIGQAEYIPKGEIEPGGKEVAVNKTHVYYTFNKSILRYNLDGKNPRLLFDVGDTMGGIAVTEDQIALTTVGGLVRRYDFTGKLLQQWEATHLGAVAIAANGDLYVVQNVRQKGDSGFTATDKTPEIVRYDAAGKLLGRIRLPKTTWVPSALALDRTNPNRLLVADASREQVIYQFTLPDLTLNATFGVPGGYLAGPTPGKTGPKRLMRPWGVGTDSNGNLYVLNGKPHTWGHRPVIQKYDAKQNLVWSLSSLAWIDTAQPTTASDGTTVYGASDRFPSTIINRSPATTGNMRRLPMTPGRTRTRYANTARFSSKSTANG